MRMTLTVALIVLLVETVLVLAVVAGAHWIGGWEGGALVGGLVLLAMVLPWLGDLTVVGDSALPAVRVKLGWWGRITVREEAGERQLQLRLLGIPWRRRLARQPTEPEPAEPKPEPPEAEERIPEAAAKAGRPRWWRQVDADTVEGAGRLGISALRAACDLVWDAHEIVVVVSDPVQRERVDRAIQGVFGRRAVGPVDLTLSHRGHSRRVRLRYRIGLLRAALTALQIVVDGRAIAFARRMKRKRAEGAAKGDSDRELIDEILQQCERDEDDGGV
ncbi:MAG: hypothetical protein ACP5KN_03290 [Armatimonadota bacterium]